MREYVFEVEECSPKNMNPKSYSKTFFSEREAIDCAEGDPDVIYVWTYEENRNPWGVYRRNIIAK